MRRGCPPGPPKYTGVFRGRSANEELLCPVNYRFLRGSDLVDWYLNNSACRPLKGVESAAGIAPNRCAVRRRLRRPSSRWAAGTMTRDAHRTDVPQQGPPIEHVGRRWAAADEGQAPPVESAQLQQRANKQHMEYRPEGDAGGTGGAPPAAFWYLFRRRKSNRAPPGAGSPDRSYGATAPALVI